MKKIVSVLMAVLLILSLSACGNSERKQPSQEENTTTNEPVPSTEEQEENLRPELANHVENLERYDTIILGFPNWWVYNE